MEKRKDNKNRILRTGEGQRSDGRYFYKYKDAKGDTHFVYSWKLEPTDKLPAGKRPCLSLRELEKQIGHDIEQRLDPTKKKMTVMELVEKYLSTKTGMRPNTVTNYKFVKNLLMKEEFSQWKIGEVKTSDAKLFLIKLNTWLFRIRLKKCRINPHTAIFFHFNGSWNFCFFDCSSMKSTTC